MPSYLIRCSALCLLLLAVCTHCPGQDTRPAELTRAITAAEQSEQAGRSLEATQHYARARAVAAQIFGANHVNVAALAQAEGMMHRKLGNFTQAEALISQGLNIAEAANDREFVAEALNNLATVKWDQAAYLESQALHRRGLQELTRQYGENSPQVAVSRNNLAGVMKSLGEYEAAEPLFLQSIKVLRSHQQTHTLELADGLMNLADLYVTRGEFPRGEMHLLEALEIKKRKYGPNHVEVGRTLNNLAALYSSMGQHEKAETHQQQSLRLIETALGPDHPDVARALINLAIDYQRLKRFDEAEPLYKRALAIRLKTVGPDHPDTALSHHNLGGFYAEREDYEQSLSFYENALATRTKIFGPDHPTLSYTLTAMGDVKLMQKELAAAEKLFAEALRIRQAKLPQNHPDLAYSHSTLAHVYGANEKWEESIRSFDASRRSFRAHIDQILPSLSESDQLSFLSFIDEPNYHSALSLVLAQPGNDQVIQATAGWVLNGKGLAQQALSQRALLARDTTNPQLAGVVKALLQVRKQLASLVMTSDTNEESASRQARIDQLAETERQQSQQLAREGGRSLGASAWIETEQVRKAIKAGSLLVEIVRFRFHDFKNPKTDKENLAEHYVAWIIRAEGDDKIQAIDLGDASEIDEVIRSARTALQAAPNVIREQGEPDAEQSLRPALKQLAVKILDPLLPLFKADQVVYLSPDSLLWLVPWSALPMDDEQYTVEKFDFRFLVTGRDLVRSETNAQVGPPIVFADPDYNQLPSDGQIFTQSVLRKPLNALNTVRAVSPTGKFKLGTVSRLPGTKAEAEAVLPNLESFANSKALVYSQQYALESVFKEIHQPRVLMLSTHGFFQEEKSSTKLSPAKSSEPPIINPLLRCGLLLAGCNKPGDVSTEEGEDGILTGLEIVSADLRGTDLVVLSACETGLGEVHNGQGVAGLRQAFQLAGARAIVSTLWQIPDRETAKLMASFFGSLAEHGDKGRALRESQLKLINARRDRNGAAHPFFWAAFTITGE